LLADPASINTKAADELERLRFTAEMKIEELEQGLNRASSRCGEDEADECGRDREAGKRFVHGRLRD